MNVTTIIFINGFWMTALSWEHWVKRYADKGYCVIAESWPGTARACAIARES
jgi:alpha-beta hydrolase superfamily lysophospholipase